MGLTFGDGTADGRTGPTAGARAHVDVGADGAVETRGRARDRRLALRPREAARTRTDVDADTDALKIIIGEDIIIYHY